VGSSFHRQGAAYMYLKERHLEVTAEDGADITCCENMTIHEHYILNY